MSDESKELQIVATEAQALPGGANTEYNELIEAAVKSGVKITTTNVLRIWRIANRQNIPGLESEILWIEQGTDKAGYQHMLKHKEEFKKVGVDESKLMEVAEAATSVGKQSGLQGKSPGRPILGLFFYKKPLAVAISVWSNGFLVGMNVSSFEKFKIAAGISEADLQEMYSWPKV